MGRTFSLAAVVMVGAALLPAGSVLAAPAPVILGTAATTSVIAATTLLNTGASNLPLGVAVGSATVVTGFPPGVVLGGLHQGDAAAIQAATDLGVTYDDLALRVPTGNVTTDLAGTSLSPGVYNAVAPLALNGVLTLDGQGDPQSVFVIQAQSDLVVGAASAVTLVNGAQPCNVWWQVANTATIAATSTFVGNVLAMSSITVGTAVAVDGRMLSRSGAVALDSDLFTNSVCDTTSTTVPTTTTVAPTTVSPSTMVAPTTVPGSVVPVRVTGAASALPAAVQAGSVVPNPTPGGAATAPDQLPFTGSDNTLLVLVGGALLLAGSASLCWGRRGRLTDQS